MLARHDDVREEQTYVLLLLYRLVGLKYSGRVRLVLRGIELTCGLHLEALGGGGHYVSLLLLLLLPLGVQGSLLLL